MTRHVVPHLAAWEEAGEIPRALHREAAAAGLLGIGFPEDVGGQGGDLVDVVTSMEAMVEAGASSGLLAALFTHAIALPHIVASGNADLIDRFVRPTLAGELIGSLGVTEPDAGSDVGALRTRAVLDGDDYVVDGAKTFITSGTPGRLRHHSGAHRRSRRPRRQPAGRGARDARVHREPEAGEDGLALLRHRGAVLRRRAGAGREPRRRRGQRLRPDHAAVRDRAAGPGGARLRRRAPGPSR